MANKRKFNQWNERDSTQFYRMVSQLTTEIHVLRYSVFNTEETFDFHRNFAHNASFKLLFVSVNYNLRRFHPLKLSLDIDHSTPLSPPSEPSPSQITYKLERSIQSFSRLLSLPCLPALIIPPPLDINKISCRFARRRLSTTIVRPSSRAEARGLAARWTLSSGYAARTDA